MDFSTIDIKTLLPQQPPFVMVDSLLHCDMVVTRTRFQVRADNLFCKDGILTEPGVIENIAQTCASRMGFINLERRGGEVRVGFIGSMRNLNLYFLPKVGEVLETEIAVQSEIFNMTLVNAKVTCNGALVADGEMKISEQ
jgi:predicted hotdog family 3-hydroxylacyl-ACP dehydratase